MKRTLYFATFLAPSLYPVYDFIAQYVGKKLNYPIELIVGTSFSQFATGGADVGFICGLPYVQLTRRPNPSIELLAAPVLEGERYRDKPIYFSDVIVRSTSRYKKFSDLRGVTWSYNDTHSHSGYNITRYTLVKAGEIDGFFGSVIEAGSHQHSIRLVCSGRVDASAIDSQILELELNRDPSLQQKIRVIETLGPATIQPIVAASHLPKQLKADMRTILLEMHKDPKARVALHEGLIKRFAAVTDSDYDDIRGMLLAAEAVGLYTLV